MKFVCLECDEQMKLLETLAPEAGSGISILYGCPKCSRRIGMLTNALETQVVSSLGVKIGGGASASDGAATASSDNLSKCPFGDVVREMGLNASDDSRPGDPSWTPEAFTRLQNIPEFVRPMAKQGIEHYARSHGYGSIDEQVLDEAREVFGM